MAVGHEYEGYLLGPEVDAVPFPHWTAHLREFFGWYDEDPDYRTSANDLPAVKAAIEAGLNRTGFQDCAAQVKSSSSGEALNCTLITQYTSEGRLYPEVNAVLRQGHLGARLTEHPLTPWVLQFNTAMRQRPLFEGVAYRGVRLNPEEIAVYRPGLMFVWGGFISASRDREVAFDDRGNAIFTITPWGSYSMYGKRNAYDIADLSALPGEAEVIFPIACTFLVVDVQTEGKRTIIDLQTVDQY